MKARHKKELVFHKLNAKLQERGFGSLHLENNDWRKAECMTRHRSDDTSLRIIIKTRLWIQESFLNSDINIAFTHNEMDFLYDHDKFVEYIGENRPYILESRSWREGGLYNWPRPPKWAIRYLGK